MNSLWSPLERSNPQPFQSQGRQLTPGASLVGGGDAVAALWWSPDCCRGPPWGWGAGPTEYHYYYYYDDDDY